MSARCISKFSRSCGEQDIPYYPIRFGGRKKPCSMGRYVDLAKAGAKCDLCRSFGYLPLFGYGCDDSRGVGSRGSITVI